MLGIKTYIKYYLQNIIYQFGGPSVIRLDPVLYRCNHSCVMCWRQQLTTRQRNVFIKEELTNNILRADQYQQFFKQLPKSVKTVEIVGSGEPLLFKGIELIMSSIKSHGIHGNLITNGVLLSKNLIRHMIGIEWDDIRISFHAGKRKTYKKIHGVDDFDLVVQNIKNVLSQRKFKRPRVELHYVIQHDNVGDIEEFVTLAEILGVDAINFELLITYKKISRTFLTKVDIKKVTKSLEFVMKEARVTNNASCILNRITETNHSLITIDDKRKTYCEVSQRELYISPNGDVVPCCFFPRDLVPDTNIKYKSLPDIWRNYRSVRERLRKGQYYPFCKKCNYTQRNIPLIYSG